MAHVKVTNRINATAYAGRWRSADGTWHQTAGHSSAADALAEARELEQAARAAALPRA